MESGLPQRDCSDQHNWTNGLSIESPAAVLNSMDTMDSAAVPGRSSNICDQAFSGLFGFWRGQPPSSDDDRGQYPPVRLAGVEQDSDPVVLEIAEAEPDSLDAFDQVVESLGGSVAHP